MLFYQVSASVGTCCTTLFFPFQEGTVEGVNEPHPLILHYNTHQCLDSVLRVTLTEETQETNNFEILENFSFKLFHTHSTNIGTFTPLLLSDIVTSYLSD